MSKKWAFNASLDILKTNPLLIYQLAVFLKYRSLTSAAMILIAFAASHLFLNILLMLNHTASRLRVIFGCLRRLQGSSFRTYTAREFFAGDEGRYEDIDRWFVKSWFRWYGIRDISLDHLVRIHVVEGSACLANLVSYPLALFESHIFVSEGPENTKGIHRFYLMHEIGHTQMKIAESDFGMLAGSKPSLFYMAWVGLTVAWSWDVSVALLSVLLATVALSQERRRRLETIRLFSEIMADTFALCYLSEENLALLGKNKYFPELLRDSDISPVFNAIRLAKLKESFSLASRQMVDELLEQTFEMFPRPNPILTTAFVLLAALPGLYAVAPTPRALLWFLLADVLLFLLFLACFIISNAMSWIIESKLAEPPVASR